MTTKKSPRFIRFLKNLDRWIILHTAIILASIAGTIAFATLHRSADAGWDDSNYTPYNPGIYNITAITPGIRNHYARHANGAPQVIGVLRYDPIPATLESTEMTFAAEKTKSITLSFSDHGLSGIARAEVRIAKPDSSLASYSTTAETLTFTHNFSKTGNFDLQYRIVDNATNDTGWKNFNNFFRVVAAVPEWTASNCSGENYFATCPSVISPTSGNKIADGADAHTISLDLVDRYGNRVVPVSGVKDVKVNFSFHNTNNLDQIEKKGDAMRIVFGEGGLDLMGADSGTTMITQTGFISEPVAGADGVYPVQILAFAPTYEGYTIVGNLIHFGLDSLRYEITPLSGLTGVGESALSLDSDFYLGFTPALTALPQAMNFVGGSYVASEDAMKNITLNSAKRFLVSLPNASTSKTVSNLELGLLILTDDTDVIWQKAILEKSHGNDVAQNLNIVTGQPMTSTWNNVPAAADSVASGATKYLRLQSTPILAPGAKTETAFATLFRTHLGYDVDGRHPRHRSGRVSVGSIVDDSDTLVTLEVHNTNIQVIGVSHSDSSIGFVSTLEGQSANSTLGDVFRTEFKSVIMRNTVTYLNDPAASAKACSNPSYTITSSNWNSFNCKFNGGKVLYFEGADVILEDSALTALRLSGGARTILVRGGDVIIKSNLVYATKEDSFGVILLKDDNHNTNPLDDGGNLFVQPNVTNISLMLYAEGSVSSVNTAGAYSEYPGTDCPINGSGGFCDRSTELRNQLYWQGSLVSQNTIGGSDTNPPACPSQFTSSTCGGRSAARIFDLNYLRTFHAFSGGKRAGGLNLIGLDTDLLLPNPPQGVLNNHALIIRYDGRIKTNTPPLFSDLNASGNSQSGY